jgi:uncharacterized membrane protein
MNSLLALALLVDNAAPEAKDVKAGWLAFGIFLLLIGATVVLCFSFVKQLRKAQAAKDAGAYGDEPISREPTAPDDEVQGS